jgi:hypothetical protein
MKNTLKNNKCNTRGLNGYLIYFEDRSNLEVAIDRAYILVLNSREKLIMHIHIRGHKDE